MVGDMLLNDLRSCRADHCLVCVSFYPVRGMRAITVGGFGRTVGLPSHMDCDLLGGRAMGVRCLLQMWVSFTLETPGDRCNPPYLVVTLNSPVPVVSSTGNP